LSQLLCAVGLASPASAHATTAHAATVTMFLATISAPWSPQCRSGLRLLTCPAQRAALSYAAVMHHGRSFTEVARQVGLSRRRISRAIQRAQIAGLTGAIPLAGLGSQTTPS